MNKIVLDSNCLLQIISRNSTYYNIWQNIMSGKITLCVTPDIIFEYEEVLSYFFSHNVSTNIISVVMNLDKLQKTDVYFKWRVITMDNDDNKFVDCAISASADFIVSDDKHFLALKVYKFPRVNVLSLAKYNKLLLKRQN